MKNFTLSTFALILFGLFFTEVVRADWLCRTKIGDRGEIENRISAEKPDFTDRLIYADEHECGSIYRNYSIKQRPEGVLLVTIEDRNNGHPRSPNCTKLSPILGLVAYPPYPFRWSSGDEFIECSFVR